MYRSKPRQVFPIVSWLTAALAIVGLGAQALRSEVPRTGRNDLSDDPVPFRRAGWTQDIDWQALTPASLKAAERAERPILIVVGSTASGFTREADRSYWADPDVEFLANQFTCFRVDDQLRPDLLPGVTPLAAAALRHEIDYGAIFLNEKRELIALYSVPGGREGLSPTALASQLRTALRLQGEGLTVDWQQDDQLAQADILRNPPRRGFPDVTEHRRALIETVDLSTGAWPSPTSIRPPVAEWLFLLEQGMPVNELEQLIEPFLRSSMVDWVDGGFFARSRAARWARPETDKYTVENADLMLFFALLHRQTGRPLYRILAERTFDWVTREALFSGIPRPYEVAEQDRLGRSFSRSASPRVMREIFSPNEREQARSLLMMRVEENPEMLPRLRQPFGEIQWSVIEVLLGKLQSRNPSNGDLDRGLRTPAVAGLVVARLRQAADLLESPERALLGESLFGQLTPFYEREGTLERSLDVLSPGPATLADSISMAQAFWWDYKLTGNGLSAEQASDWMIRTLETHLGSDGELISLDGKAWGGLLDNFALPVIRDRHTTSPVAQATRLAFEIALWREAQGDRPEIAQRLRAFAEDQATRYGPLIDESPLGYTGLVSAAATVQSDRAALVIGPRAAAVASSLRVRFPHQIVLPIRREGIDLETPHRVVLMTQGQLSSPMTVEEAPEQIAAWTPAK